MSVLDMMVTFFAKRSGINSGHIEDGKLYVRTWRLPELIPERFEERSLYDTPHECLITKKGILDGQKLQAQDDRAGM